MVRRRKRGSIETISPGSLPLLRGMVDGLQRHPGRPGGCPSRPAGAGHRLHLRNRDVPGRTSGRRDRDAVDDQHQRRYRHGDHRQQRRLQLFGNQDHRQCAVGLSPLGRKTRVRFSALGVQWSQGHSLRPHRPVRAWGHRDHDLRRADVPHGHRLHRASRCFAHRGKFSCLRWRDAAGDSCRERPNCELCGRR